MKRFVQGECRTQATLLPELLDDYISEGNAVRVVDVFVDELNLGELGFESVTPAATGRPAYHPAILLKIYIYGYLNRIQWMGATHFLTRTLDRVSTEMGLHVLAYNLKRVMHILGPGVLMEAMRALFLHLFIAALG